LRKFEGEIYTGFTQIEMSFNTIIGFKMSPEPDGLGLVLLWDGGSGNNFLVLIRYVNVIS